ncbi:MAG: phosphate-starvation-inducible PsiE family protein [Prochloraceae cyanobacterium]|nr:phosphate-starvation-inducible PsiE family protein [Prochloraceae cyanobacterium]
MIESKSKSSQAEGLFSRRRLLVNLDAFQDILVIILMLALLVHMALLLFEIFLHLRDNPEFKQIADEMLQVLILVEIFRLMAVYLESHHIPLREGIEVALISVLREVIVIGILHIYKWEQIIAIGSFMMMAGILLYLDSKSGGHGHGGGHH